MRPSHAVIVLAILISGCGVEAGEAASASSEVSVPPSASLAPSAAAAPSTTPTAPDEPDWSALSSLEDAVIATAPIDGPLAGRYTTAAAGALWVPNGGGGAPPAVARFDDETLEPVATVELGGSADAFPPEPEATAPGADGVWATLAAQDAVALIDPATNAESRRVPVEGDPYSLVESGADLWVVDFGAGAVVRVDIATGEELLRVTSVPSPIQVAVAFGSLWVADHESGNIVRVDPETGDAIATIPVGGRPGVAIGFDSVWARSDDEGTVTRIDPATNEAVATIRMPDFATDIEVAGDSVWVAGGPQRGSCEETGYLVRIDPTTNEADGYLPINCPTSLTTDGTGLWVGTTLEGETNLALMSLDPDTRP